MSLLLLRTLLYVPRDSKMGEVGGGEQVPVPLLRKESAWIVWREICWRLTGWLLSGTSHSGGVNSFSPSELLLWPSSGTELLDNNLAKREGRPSSDLPSTDLGFCRGLVLGRLDSGCRALEGKVLRFSSGVVYGSSRELDFSGWFSFFVVPCFLGLIVKFEDSSFTFAVVTDRSFFFTGSSLRLVSMSGLEVSVVVEELSSLSARLSLSSSP